MRPIICLFPGLLAITLGGCVSAGYAGGGYVQQVAPPQPAYYGAQEYGAPEPTYYNDQPAVLYGGQPAYIIEEPTLGFGWYDPGHRWHHAPPEWRHNIDRGRQGQPIGRPEGRPQMEREPNRSQPYQPAQGQPQRFQSPRQEQVRAQPGRPEAQAPRGPQAPRAQQAAPRQDNRAPRQAPNEQHQGHDG